MFALTPGDLLGKILDCASGPASFNAELAAEGHEVTSCDPLYSSTAEEIRARIDATFDTLVDHARVAYDEFIWREIESPEHLGEVRVAAMQRFLRDFPEGLEERRYLARALPHLYFRDDAFDLALCSAFLFTYTEQLSLDFHVAAIEEMCRVAGEARIFPLLKGYGGPSPYLEPVITRLRDRGYTATIREVPYEFQRGGDQMLAVRKPEAPTGWGSMI
jgi:hypothetical protein